LWWHTAIKKVVDVGIAHERIISGAIINTEKAFRIGLVNKVSHQKFYYIGLLNLQKFF
tara:strand:- start:1876 stop:2049 length:174 start_codon:yes stop_codon:yes gene_type:complete